MSNDAETNINLYQDQRSIFSNDKTLVTKLKRLGVPVKCEKESGTWFDLTGVSISVQVPKIRGTGYKSENI